MVASWRVDRGMTNREVMNTDRNSSPQTAIHELIDLYADDVYRFAIRSVRNHADAKDVVQEVFLRAYKAWGDFRYDASPKTWLLTITRNYLKDYYRRKYVRDRYETNSCDDTFLQESSSVEGSIDLKDAISRLKSDHRQVIVLRFIEDMSVEETSRVLGWSQAKVRTAQHRAIKQLRLLLENQSTGGMVRDILSRGR